MEPVETTALATQEPEPLLGSVRCELTQNAIELALQEFNTSYTIEKYVEQQRGAFFIKVGGPVTLSNFGLQIVEGRGIPSVDITNEFKLYYRIPLLGERQFESLPFQISAPTMRVALHSIGSKAFATLFLDTLKIELPQNKIPEALTRGRLSDIYDLVKQSTNAIVEELTRALNDKLQREPFQLFDLSYVEIPLGETKKLPTRIELEQFEFGEDRILVSVSLFSTAPRTPSPKAKDRV